MKNNLFGQGGDKLGFLFQTKTDGVFSLIMISILLVSATLLLSKYVFDTRHPVKGGKAMPSFLTFYFYLFKKDSKKYDLAHNNMTSIIITPIVLAVVAITAGVLTSSMIISILGLFSFIFSMVNIAVTDAIFEQALEIKLEEHRKDIEKRSAKIQADWDEMLERLERQKREYEQYWYKTQQQYQSRFNDQTSKNWRNAMHLLGLKNDKFTKVDVKKAYKRMSQIHHPDVGGLEENFKKLNTAYKYIMKRI